MSKNTIIKNGDGSLSVTVKTAQATTSNAHAPPSGNTESTDPFFGTDEDDDILSSIPIGALLPAQVPYKPILDIAPAAQVPVQDLIQLPQNSDMDPPPPKKQKPTREITESHAALNKEVEKIRSHILSPSNYGSFDIDKVQFLPPSTGTGKGHMIGIKYGADKLFIQVPTTISFGITAYMGEESKRNPTAKFPYPEGNTTAGRSITLKYADYAKNPAVAQFCGIVDSIFAKFSAQFSNSDFDPKYARLAKDVRPPWSIHEGSLYLHMDIITPKQATAFDAEALKKKPQRIPLKTSFFREVRDEDDKKSYTMIREQDLWQRTFDVGCVIELSWIRVTLVSVENPEDPSTSKNIVRHKLSTRVIQAVEIPANRAKIPENVCIVDTN